MRKNSSRFIKGWLILTFLASIATSQSAVLFTESTNWKYFKPFTQPPFSITEWRQIGFNDASWLTGQAPFFYETSAGYSGNVNLTDMQNGYSGIFMRKSFTVTDPAEISSLQLDVDSDDGCIVWINGVEVARIQVTGDIAWNGVASGSAGEPNALSRVLLDTSFLVAGENVMAIHAVNASLGGSSDFLISASLGSTAPDFVAPTIMSISPTPGSILNELTSLTVTFTEPVSGVSSDDLEVNGARPISVSGSDDVWTWTFSEVAFGMTQIHWAPGHGIADFANPPNAFNSAGQDFQYELRDIVAPEINVILPGPTLILPTLTQIDITFTEPVTGVDKGDLLINLTPAASMTSPQASRYIFTFPQPLDGPVQVEWAAAHGITDLAATPNPFVAGQWAYTVDPSAPPADLVINEFLAANRTGLMDEDLESEDWIEIYNRGVTAVDLAGWALADQDDLSLIWVFPPHILGPGEYLVVFASGKNRKAPVGGNRFHTNFRLSSTGEHLGLYTAESPRNLAHGFDRYPDQRNDHSYGLDNTGELKYFSTPTPGGPNGVSTVKGVVDSVEFSVSRGYYDEPFDLHLSTPTRSAHILYTLNGTEPTEVNGTRYAGPIHVDSSMQLRAAGFRTDYLPSRVSTHSYLYNLPNNQRGLPALSVVTDESNLTGPTGIVGIGGGTYNGGVWAANGPNDYDNLLNQGIAWERPVSAELILTNDNSGFAIDAGIRSQGSDWQRPRYTSGSKFSYRLYFRGDYGPTELVYPWMLNSVVPNFDVVVLRAGKNDLTNPFIYDQFTRQIHADTGQVASHGTFVNLFINGVLKGYFNPCERIEENFASHWHGGSTDWDILTVGSRVQEGDAVAWNALRSLVNSQDVTSPAVYADIMTKLDLVNFADYMIVNCHGATWDWPHNNWRAARQRDPAGKFRFYVWDGEGGFGFNRAVNYNIFTDGSFVGNSEISTFYKRLRLSPEFRLLWADRVQKHYFNGGALTEAHLRARFEQLRIAMATVLPNMQTALRDSYIPQRRANIMPQYTSQGLLAGANAPTFNQHGGEVPFNFGLTMTASPGNIHYTLEGSDPRVLFSGAVSPQASLYMNGSPVRLTESVVVKARTLNGGTWSALSEALFTVASLGVPLRITEINYNPPGGTAYEFVEIKNISGGAVDLSGMSFDGIMYLFPEQTTIASGEIMVFISDDDPIAFSDRYPGVVAAGQFAGGLANGGERLAILDGDGNVIVSVDYSDSNGWPTEPDVSDRTLEIVNVDGDPDSPANWQASSQSNGSPGVIGSSLPAPDIHFNELLAENLTAVENVGTYPDMIELHNRGGASVDLGGWSMTDDGNRRKFVFAPGTILPADGYLALWADSITNTTPGTHLGFSLDNDGESVFLYDASSNRVDGITLGQQVPDFSVGLIGNEWMLNLPTAGAVNSAATLASATSLVVNEWMADSLPGQEDWLELFNTSAVNPVSLQGIYVGTDIAVHRLSALSFLAPRGHLQLHADEMPGNDHLDFKLPSAGGAIFVADPLASEVNRVTYGVQSEGVSQGRLPDGAASIVNFPGSASPGSTNFLNDYNGPTLNEFLARNQSVMADSTGQFTDWVELRNPSGSSFDLGGMRLSVGSANPDEWIFPPGTTIPANGYLIVWCDDTRPASLLVEAELNMGQTLSGESGGIFLFNAAGQLVDDVEYGFQVRDQSLGLVGATWRLLTAPSPGAANDGIATLGSVNDIRVNEWMAAPRGEDDWFELYNSGTQPVAMAGLYLTDDPSTVGRRKFQVEALSFIGGKDWVRWEADSNLGAGRNHVNFDLAGSGESLRIYSSGLSLIDGVSFGAQIEAVSQGRLADGGGGIVPFPGSPTPAEANFIPAENAVINEVRAKSQAGSEDAVELHNPTSTSVNIGGWFLSDSRDDYRKYEIPGGTTIPAGGFVVISESDFSAAGVVLNAARGGELFLSAADGGGSLTGVRSVTRYGASAEGITAGPHRTPVSENFVAMSGASFGSGNSGPLVGPLVISELMYHPPDVLVGIELVEAANDEFIELHNISGSPVALADAVNPGLGWRLSGAVQFQFPPGATIGAGERVLLVHFDPLTDAIAANAFRALYGVDPGVVLHGPFQGRLGNGGENLQLYRPDEPVQAPDPDAGFIPQILVDKVDYSDSAPWPTGAVDGGGMSLQRRVPSAYGNNPESWMAGLPTAGTANVGGAALPLITASPTGLVAIAGNTEMLFVSATGPGPLSYQWRFGGHEIEGATAATLILDDVALQDEGTYDVFVSNASGSIFSDSASIVVAEPPAILARSSDIVVDPGVNVNLSVTAAGSAPLTYQWRRNGVPIAGANGLGLSIANAQLEDSGTYTVVVGNNFGTVTTGPILVQVLVRPEIVHPLQDQVVAAGSTLVLSVVARGTTPMGFRWRRGGTTIGNFVLDSTTSILALTNVQTGDSGSYTVVLTNVAFSQPGVLSPRATIAVVADTDRDGLHDQLEIDNGLNPNDPSDALQDPDGDTINTRDEFISGTDFMDGQSYLKVAEIEAAGIVTIRFLARANITYSIQYNDTTANGPWFKLGNVGAQTLERVESVIDPLPVSNRIYRLVTPGIPD